MKEIPAVVREMDDSTAFEAAIAENAVRQNLDPLENVEILVSRLRQRGLDDEGVLEVMRRARSQIRRNRFGPEARLLMEITSSLGVSPSTVAVGYRHLFRLPEWLRKSLKGYQRTSTGWPGTPP
jgi:ParB-like chromosome segregation protein Spo0J